MRICMLGWEFPPFVAGGLGTACHGLTRALDQLGHEVLFLLPRPIDEPAGPDFERVQVRGGEAATPAGVAPAGSGSRVGEAARGMSGADFVRAVLRVVPSARVSPYGSGDRATGRVGASAGLLPEGAVASAADKGAADFWSMISEAAADARASVAAADGPSTSGTLRPAAQSAYAGDTVAAAQRYARLVVSMASHEPFDVIHAHDWMTYPAGLALRAVTRKPLVVHVHATEFDRSGGDATGHICALERAGMHGADRVVVVSEMTRRLCEQRYGVPGDKIDVVYNGVDPSAQPAPGAAIERDDKIVLFLGRLTGQKGPEYFIRAAARVLEKVPNAKFVVAGSGDLGVEMVEQAAAAGLARHVLFTGFLRGDDVGRVFQMADCFVMPSVSEPFGIAALEAVQHDTPVIISKQSGVAEVLTHALKVDFWDVDDIANKIVAVLRHPPLGATLREHGSVELHRLTWARAADLVVRSYHRAGVGVL